MGPSAELTYSYGEGAGFSQNLSALQVEYGWDTGIALELSIPAVSIEARTPLTSSPRESAVALMV